MSGYPKSRFDATAAGSVLPALAVIGVLGGAMVLANLGGDDLRRAWSLDGARIRQGEVWRLVTAHLVNLSPRHTFQNLLGLGLIAAALWPVLNARDLIRSVAASAAAISLGMLLLQPDWRSYVGFSAITHGVLLYGGLVMLRAGPRRFGILVVACTGLKIGWELVMGAVPSAAEAIGGDVSLLSHSLGALGGALAAPVAWRLRGAVALVCAMTLVPNTLKLRRADAPAAPPHAAAPPFAAPPFTAPPAASGTRTGNDDG